MWAPQYVVEVGCSGLEHMSKSPIHRPVALAENPYGEPTWRNPLANQSSFGGESHMGITQDKASSEASIYLKRSAGCAVDPSVLILSMFITQGLPS